MSKQQQNSCHEGLDMSLKLSLVYSALEMCLVAEKCVRISQSHFPWSSFQPLSRTWRKGHEEPKVVISVRPPQESINQQCLRLPVGQPRLQLELSCDRHALTPPQTFRLQVPPTSAVVTSRTAMIWLSEFPDHFQRALFHSSAVDWQWETSRR